MKNLLPHQRFFLFFCNFVPVKSELSILIPVFNDKCTQLVHQLSRQVEAIQNLRFEILVADDGSTQEDCISSNRAIEALPHCSYIVRGKNVGRAAIRNFLARQAQYEWLLFLDCDMQVPHDRFLEKYLTCESGEVIDGGFAVVENPSLYKRSLRYTYEWTMQSQHTAEQRRKRPYQHFRTTNFMVRRDIMLRLPFDERIRRYGFEDVLFGKLLRKEQVGICHIDNPMMLADVEDNATFVAKTEEALHTLHTFKADLRGYSNLLTFVEGIHLGVVRGAICLFHRCFKKWERSNLVGNNPSLRVFKLYKLGYFMAIEN